MTDREALLRRIRRANPAPPDGALPAQVADSRPPIAWVMEPKQAMANATQPKAGRHWHGPAIAAGSFAAVLLIALPLLFLRGGDETATSGGGETTTVAPSTTAGTVTSATTIAAPSTTVAPTTTATSEAPPSTVPTEPGLGWARIEGGDVFGGSPNQFLYAVTAGGPGLVAVGTAGSYSSFFDGAVWVSADGYTWARIPHDEAVFGGPGNQVLNGVAAGGPGLVAVGLDGSSGDQDAAVWVSADGYTWTRIDDEVVFGGPGDQAMWSVTAVGPGLVAVGEDDSGGDRDAAVWVSADGYTWDRIPHDEAVFGGDGNQYMLRVAAGGPGLVAIGQGAVWVSTDGYTWATVDDEPIFGAPGNQVLMAVAAGGPGLVAVGEDDFGGDRDAAVWVSADGYTWTRIPHDEAVFGGSGDQVVTGIASGEPGLVAVGWDGASPDWTTDTEATRDYMQAAVWVSTDGYTWIRVEDQAALSGAGAQWPLAVAAWRPGWVAVGVDIAGRDEEGAVWVSPPPG